MNITVRQIEFKSTNGENTVFGWLYIPAEPARAVVQISHGMAEHMGRYHEFMRFLAQNGYIACGIDHIGHGRSAQEERFGFFAQQDGWKTLIEDQHKFYKIVRSELPNQTEIILFGHSMGSFVARLYAAKYPQTLSGLILSGTGRSGLRVELAAKAAAFSVHKNGAYYIDRDLNRLTFGGFNDRFQPTKSGYDWLTGDAEIVKRYTDDPLCGFVFTVSAFRDLFTLIGKSNDRSCFELAAKNTPILIVSGAMDPVGEYGKGPEQVCRRYRRAGVQDVELVLYEGSRHEPLNESNRTQVYDELLCWLNDRFSLE